MARTLRDLIEELEDLEEEFGPEAEVRLAEQPRWAFEYSIGEVAGANVRDDDGKKKPVIYIAEGSQLGYLSGAASRAIGWGGEPDDDDEDDEDEDETPGALEPGRPRK